MAKILEEAGLQAGLLNVVVGSGSEIGDAFVSHPVPRVISFTGSTPVGRNVARLAAEASIFKRVGLELGGNGTFTVLADADLDRAIDAAIFGKFLHQGQICTSINRFIVDDTVHDEFLERFAARVGRLKVGDPQGLMLPPHVFADVTNDMHVAAAESFGPIATIIRVRGDDEALRVANDTEHGLSGAVSTPRRPPTRISRLLTSTGRCFAPAS